MIPGSCSVVWQLSLPSMIRRGSLSLCLFDRWGRGQNIEMAYIPPLPPTSLPTSTNASCVVVAHFSPRGLDKVLRLLELLGY